jgi:colicin import membrane protein
MALKHLPVAMVATLALAGCGTELLAIPATAPTPSFTSIAEADQALEQARRDRASLEKAYTDSERVCYERFFVNRCLDEAKERRRVGMGVVRATEVEAERYKRETAANDHDRELARIEAQLALEESARAAEPPAPPRDPKMDAPPTPSGKPLAQRKAEKAARDAVLAKKDATSAARRAQLVKDREARRAESARRQQAVEEKRKAREAEQVADPKPQ